MRPRKHAQQVHLFETPRSLELKERIRELDLRIAAALKRGEYDRARELTREQEELIQELVDLGDADQAPKETGGSGSPKAE